MSDLFKSLVWDALIKAAIARLFSAVPLLAWGPLGAVVTWIVMKFADQLYAAAEMAINLEKIVLVNDLHRKAFDQASLKLRVIAHDRGIDSKEFKDAREHHKAALSQFVQFATG